jgi:hypothetical protein
MNFMVIAVEPAERAGFEPAVPFRAHTISSRAPSTARSPLLTAIASNTAMASSIAKLRWQPRRRARDSNPRYPLGAHLISNQAPSTTRTALRGASYQRNVSCQSPSAACDDDVEHDRAHVIARCIHATSSVFDRGLLRAADAVRVTQRVSARRPVAPDLACAPRSPHSSARTRAQWRRNRCTHL